MPRNFPLAILLALLCAIAAIPAQAIAPPTTQRAFVSGNGNNANVATLCAVTAPCKTFAAAVTVVAVNGEVVALDTAPYGSVTLTQSITLTAAPGVYAGISVFAGAGVTIATPGVNVVLRGININSQGGTFGVSMTAGTSLSIENCVISNFASGSGAAVAVNAAATVRVINSLVRDSFVGISLAGGATATIAGTSVVGSPNVGVVGIGLTGDGTTTAYISDTVVSGNNIGISTLPNAGATTRVFITRTTITGGALDGLDCSSNITGATSLCVISDSMVTGNGRYGLLHDPFNGGVATLFSTGNNTVSNNNPDTFGTITPLTFK